MKNVFLGLALAAMLLPLAACSHPDQSSSAASDNPAVAQARADAKTNSLQALSADHQAKVNAIVANYKAGSVAAPDAAQQIDAILTPAESSAVLAQQTKMREAFRAAGGGNRPSGFRGNRNRKPDAGRFLLQVLGR